MKLSVSFSLYSSKVNFAYTRVLCYLLSDSRGRMEQDTWDTHEQRYLFTIVIG